jgi:predicted metal-dependent HD superfamily phosphohydrolase
VNDLRASWQSAWAATGWADPGRAFFDELLQRYREPQRRYHTLQHLGECLAQAPRVTALAERPGEVLVALWFHDAVYDIGRRDNEARSALMAHDAVRAAGGSDEAAQRVHGLVMATEHRAVPSTLDAQVLVDVDLSILGAAPTRFDEYELQVRDEYRHVPGFLFRSKRRAVLEGFLQRERIFNTEAFVQALEAQARSNLRRSIDRLGG